ncbi:MAG: GntR family transcriptional regulator [Paralcaligenes sp.]
MLQEHQTLSTEFQHPGTVPVALGNRVYEHLKADILAQEILPATLLQESEIGEQFGVSRTPVREALRNLLNEGLIRRSGRFYQVIEMSTKEIQDLYEVREALERAAVRLFIERAGDTSIERLFAIIESQTQALSAQDFMAFANFDTEFHLTIAATSNNPLLFQQLSAVHDKAKLVRRRDAKTTPKWFNGVIVEHERILNALGRRDIAVADAEMRYHLNSVIRLHRGLKQEPRGRSVSAI